MRHTIARDGIVAGILGATAVALWFLGVDTIAGHPFATPAALGRGLVGILGPHGSEGTVVFVQMDARGVEEEIRTEKGATALDLPVVCLIDRGSASSAEILAGALQVGAVWLARLLSGPRFSRG